MTGVALPIDATAGAPAYNGRAYRNAHAALMAFDGVVLAGRQGVRPTNLGTLVTLVGSTITANTHTGIVSPGWSTVTGSYEVALTVAETHTLTPAAGSARKDIVIGRVYDDTESASGLRLYRSEYIAGVAGSGVEPAVPAGGMRLATIDVPASGGGSAVVTINPNWTCALGGLLLVSSVTMRTAIVAHDGQAIYRLDRDWVEIYDGTAWRVQGLAVCSSTADRDSAITNPHNGQYATTTDTGTLWQRHSGAWREFPFVPYAHIYQVDGGQQAILNATATAITFTAEVTDNVNGHSTVTNTSRFTPNVAGTYRCHGGVAMENTAAGPMLAQFRKNGSVVAGASPYGILHAVNQGSVANVAHARGSFSMNGTTDYLELWTTHVFGSTRNTFATIAGDATSHAIFERVGP